MTVKQSVPSEKKFQSHVLKQNEQSILILSISEKITRFSDALVFLIIFSNDFLVESKGKVNKK